MGKVRSRDENGYLFFDFRYQGKRCREQTTLKDTPTNRRRMERVLERIERDIVSGTFDYGKYFPGSKKATEFTLATEQVDSGSKKKATKVKPKSLNTPLFSDFTETWFQENTISWRLNTQKAQRCNLRKHLLPEFGARKVHEITKADILGFRARLGSTNRKNNNKPLATKSINEVINSLMAIMAEASDRFKFDDPTVGIKRLKIQKAHIDPLSLEEVQKFLSIVRRDYKNYFTVRFFTGMRTGEIHGLKWKYVDFERREILVRETFMDGRTEYTKNDGSQREIYISDLVLEALLELHKATSKTSEYVFCNRNGDPINAMNVNKRIWKPTLALIGLSERRLYQTRHTAATLWLGSGENPEWIARQMGHTSTQMLFSVYSRYVPNLTRQDGSAFEKMLKAHLQNQPIEDKRITLSSIEKQSGGKK